MTQPWGHYIGEGHTLPNLVEILPGEEGLVVGAFLQQCGEGARLLTLLPGGAAAVALQCVVEDVVVVRVLASEDAGSARAAQWTGHKLRGGLGSGGLECSL